MIAPMNKYGVHEDAEHVKQATEMERKCPYCGAKLLSEGPILLCPTHGSQPFEANDTDGKKD